MEKEAYGKIAWEAIQKNFSHLQGIGLYYIKLIKYKTKIEGDLYL
jgi:hypothetical protein